MGVLGHRMAFRREERLGNLCATSWNTILLLNDGYAILYCFQTTCENKVLSLIYENILGIFIFKSLRELAACAPNKKQFALQPTLV